MQIARDEPTPLMIVQALRPLILANRQNIETSRRLPDAVKAALTAAGLFRVYVPEAYGGLDLSPVAGMEVLEELARADASVAWCVWNGNAHWTTVQLDPEIAQVIYHDPAVIIANSTRPSGHADVVAGGYRVSGQWSLVSGCELSDWMILLCAVVEDGRAHVTHKGAPVTRFMLCPSKECEIIDTWTVGGLRGTGSHDVVVRELFVPFGYASSFNDPVVITGSRYLLPPLSRIIPGLGAMALGTARTAVESLVDLATAKRPDRADRPLCEYHGAQVALAKAEALIRSARLFLFSAVGELWMSVIAGAHVTNEAKASVRLAAVHAVSSSVAAVDLIYSAAGATSLYTSCPIERAFRDVHAMAQHISVHQRVLETTGQILFGLEPTAAI